MKQRLAIILTILGFLPLTIAAQELELLMEKVERTIKTREPEWKLRSKSFEENTCIAVWAHTANPKEEYLAIIRVTPSEKKTADDLALNRTTISGGARGVKVPGIGEEAYLLGDIPGRPVSLYFRKPNISIKLLAPSENHVRRLAKIITDSIPAITSPPVRKSKL